MLLTEKKGTHAFRGWHVDATSLEVISFSLAYSERAFFGSAFQQIDWVGRRLQFGGNLL